MKRKFRIISFCKQYLIFLKNLLQRFINFRVDHNSSFQVSLMHNVNHKICFQWPSSEDRLMYSFKVLCYFQFLKKHELCLNSTKSLLRVNPILSAKTMTILRCNSILLFYFTRLSTMLQASISSFKIV